MSYITPVAVVWRALLGLEHYRGAIPGPFVGWVAWRAGEREATRLEKGLWTASLRILLILCSAFIYQPRISGRGPHGSDRHSASLVLTWHAVDADQPRGRSSGMLQRKDQTWPGIQASVPGNGEFSIGISQL